MSEQYAGQGSWDSSERLVTTIVAAVADHTGRDVADLDPLYEVVDSEALAELFKPRPNGQPRDNGARVEFTYAGCEVLVTGSSDITVRPTDRAHHSAPTD